MALQLHSDIRKDYPFLARPPPPQKKRPIQPLPPPPSPRSFHPYPAQATPGPCRRSSTFSVIASWAAHVQPGSPASLSPRSPYRRPSLRKGRHPSVASIRVPSASFLHVAPKPTTAFTPTPSVRDFKADLTTVGYTSVFLQFPTTPVSATLTLSLNPPSPSPTGNTRVPVASPTCKPRGFTRFRSLSVLRSRGRSKSAGPHSPTRMKAKAAAASSAIVKRKKAKYAMRPPPLANELALMQFVDGGDLDHNIKRVMEAQAKALDGVCLSDVHRDGESGIWWDQDEEWEYAHLLTEGDESCPRTTGDLQWVTFDGNSPPVVGMPGEDRRGSVSTQDSDPDPKRLVQPMDSMDGDGLALFGSAVVSPMTPKHSVSVLSLPSRPRRAAQHLRKPSFLVDAAFSWPHASPKSPRHPASSGASAGTKSKGKARRRPAPLKLSPPSPAFERPSNSPFDADQARRDFIDASFQPTDCISARASATAASVSGPREERPRALGNSRGINAPWRSAHDGVVSLRMKRKPSVLNMMGLFRSARKEEAMGH